MRFRRLLPCLLALPALAVTPPWRPANPVNRDGFWVGQSEPGIPCYTTIALASTAVGNELAVTGEVTVEPRTGVRPRVIAEWIAPTGEHWRQIELADEQGVAHFHCRGTAGRYRLRILEVQKVRHRYDPERGQSDVGLAAGEADE